MAGGGPASFRTLSHEGVYEFTEKKSRFVGYAAPALEEADAMAFVESVEARHPGCSAVLYAYVCGYSGAAQRYHDSHEPSGGILMLEALKRQGVTGAATAVARYFGGVKLGAGPLGRAFGLASAEAVTAAEPCLVEKSVIYAVSFDYSLSGVIERRFQHSPWKLQGLSYGERIEAEAAVRESDVPAFLAEVADLSSGKATPVRKSERYLNWQRE